MLITNRDDFLGAAEFEEADMAALAPSVQFALYSLLDVATVQCK